MMKKTKRVLALIIIGVLGLFPLGCRGNGPEKIVVTMSPARTGSLRVKSELNGILTANETVNIFTKIGGQVQTVGADVGNQVSAGQLLLQLDTKELNAQLQQAQAAVQAVKDQADQAMIAIDTANSNLELIQKSYDRAKALFDAGAISQSQLDDAQNKLIQAKNAYENAHKQLNTASGSGLAQAVAAENLLQIEIGNGTINCPVSGIVSSRKINPGEIAIPGTPLMTVVDISTLKMQGNISQELVPLLAIGKKVSLTVDALPGQILDGEITQIGPVSTSAGQYFPVVITVKNPGSLMAGMTATASVIISIPARVIVPLSALRNSGGNDYVFMVRDGIAHRQQVKLGYKNNSEVQVISGLNLKDNVATSNLGILHDNMKVTGN
jgi:RND family efflux transporter MFP subunit